MVDDDELDGDARSAVVVDAPEWFKVEGVGGVAQGQRHRSGAGGGFPLLQRLPLRSD